MATENTMHPPRTIAEVFKSLPEGTPAQLIEDNIVMEPSPTYYHQNILMKLGSQLHDYIEKHHLGEVLVAPLDVYLGKKNVFQPDILFVSNERLSMMKKDGMHGAPDLVVEILSPATAKYDLEEKKDVYERYGVKEYFVIEQGTLSVQGYYLINAHFEEIEAKSGEINSRLLNICIRF
ncbi:MAG: Uma2 family endonuclease [Chitinophagaceae bacterium]